MCSAQAQQINLVNPDDVEFFFDETHHVALHHRPTGIIHKRLRVSLMFPLTDRDAFVQLTDEAENEVGIVRRIAELDATSQQVIANELDKSYFIPRITAIHAINQKFGSDIWEVATEKGPRCFEVVGKRRNIRYLTHDHIVIRDIDGNRYEIPSFGGLDKASRRLLTREI